MIKLKRISIRMPWIIPVSLCMLAVMLMFGCSSRSGEEFTGAYTKLINEMTQDDRIARLDVPSSSIITSYDRTGGNDDCNNYIRKGPKGWWVIADLQGPGYISRFWVTGVEPSHRLRMYFDNEKRSRLDISLGEYFGEKEQFCWYSFVPVPYSKRLIVMVEEGPADPKGWPKLFYQINYNCLSNEADVVSFPRKLTAVDRDIIKSVRDKWEKENVPNNTKDKQILIFDKVLEPGQTVTCDPIRGTAMINSLRITPDLSAVKSALTRSRVLRDIVLRISWDQADFSSVEVPLSDFFGSMWRPVRFDSMFFGMEGNAFISRFPMPFRSLARISFENQGEETVSLKTEIGVKSVNVWDDQWGYFHAGWRRTGPELVGNPHPIVHLEGDGKYIGCILGVKSEDKSFWILEGDETIRIDNEVLPGWKGTGLEDYFNGGWYYQNPLARPLHGLLYKTPFSTIQYRFHVNDSVVFRNSIDMEFERGPNHASKGWMESVAYYYMRKPAKAYSDIGSAQLRRPSSSPFAPATIMTDLINLERFNDFQGAYNRIDEFMEEHPDFFAGPILRLRQIAYEEKILGFNKVKEKYEEFIKKCADKTAIAEAKRLLWYHSDPRNALLGVYCNARTKVFIDGQQLAEVDHPEHMFVRPLVLNQGKHVLAVESKWSRSLPWVQICLRTQQGDVVTSPDWKWTRSQHDNWQNLNYDDSSWEEYGRAGCKGPPEIPFVRVIPNAFVGMQSRAIGIRTRRWGEDKYTVFFRKEFEILP
ncbi:glycoside hydrolase family 172 protein [Verrucomicrobiota bacterium]